MDDNKRIIEAMRKSPESGFHLLMAKYGEPVYWHIRRILVRHEDAEDAAQETFVRIFRSFRQYHTDSSFKAWIYRIATNEALRILDKRQRMETVPIEDVQSGIILMEQPDYIDMNDKIAIKFQEAIGRLPSKQKLSFSLRYYDDMTYEEIATVTGSTAASAKANYHVAKEKIIKFMNVFDKPDEQRPSLLGLCHGEKTKT